MANKQLSLLQSCISRTIVRLTATVSEVDRHSAAERAIFYGGVDYGGG